MFVLRLTLCKNLLILSCDYTLGDETMETATLQINIPTEKYSQLAEIAALRQLVMADVLELAITEWLEREIRLQKARQVMRELGEGLDEGQAPHDAARNHDVYLYGKAT